MMEDLLGTQCQSSQHLRPADWKKMIAREEIQFLSASRVYLREISDRKVRCLPGRDASLPTFGQQPVELICCSASWSRLLLLLLKTKKKKQSTRSLACCCLLEHDRWMFLSDVVCWSSWSSQLMNVFAVAGCCCCWSRIDDYYGGGEIRCSRCLSSCCCLLSCWSSSRLVR